MNKTPTQMEVIDFAMVIPIRSLTRFPTAADLFFDMTDGFKHRANQEQKARANTKAKYRDLSTAAAKRRLRSR